MESVPSDSLVFTCVSYFKCSPSIHIPIQLNGKLQSRNTRITNLISGQTEKEKKKHSSLMTSFTKPSRELDCCFKECCSGFIWATQWQEGCEVVWSPGNPWLRHQSRWLMLYQGIHTYSHKISHALICQSNHCSHSPTESLCSLRNAYLVFVGYEIISKA